MKKIYLLLLFCTLFGGYIKSQVLWSAPAGQAWLTNTNWTGNVIPTTTEIAQFGINPTGGLGIGINMNDPTNNGTNNQAVGALEITNARSSNLVIGNSSISAGGTLTLNGATVNGIANVIVRNNSTGALTIDNTQALGNQTMQVALGNATDNRIYIDNTGGVTINTVVSGAARALSLYGAGSGIVELNAANTYTGLTTVAASILRLNNTGGGTLPAANNVIILSGGTLRISTNQTLNNVVLSTGAVLTIDAGVTLTVNGTFSHNGGTISGTGNIAYGVGATLSYGATIPQTCTNVEYPGPFGPSNLTINNAAGVILHASRTITMLTLTNGNLTIGNNSIIANGITGSSSASYIVTNGTGKLTRTNISTLTLFPIGTATTFNPLTIGNGTNPSSLNYSVKVDVGFTAAIIANANLAINRTWYVTSSATPTGSVLIGFYYTGTPATDAGSLFSVAPATVDHGVFLPLGYGWNVNQTGLTQVPFGGSMYVASTTVSSFLGQFDFPMVIGNLGAILSTPRLVDLSAQKINNTAQLNWTNNTSAFFKEVIVERSANGRNFETLAPVSNTTLSYTDNQLLAGTNYYRIKLTDINRRISYSAIAAVINGNTGFDVVGLLPNIVTSIAQLNITTAKKTPVNIVVTDMAGRPVLKQVYNAVAGSNLFTVNAAALAAGMYYVTATTATGEVKTIRFVKQ